MCPSQVRREPDWVLGARGSLILGTTGPNDVLLKLNATGLCMSDIHFMMNDWAVPPMSTFGTK